MRFWKKTVSILLVHAFLLSGITTGLMPSAIATTLDKTSPIIEVATTPDSIVIPKDCGMIKSKFIGKGDKLIVHIQDAHCNYEAHEKNLFTLWIIIHCIFIFCTIPDPYPVVGQNEFTFNEFPNH